MSSPLPLFAGKKKYAEEHELLKRNDLLFEKMGHRTLTEMRTQSLPTTSKHTFRGT